MDPFKKLAQCGQSVWLDDIHRHLLTSGRFRALVEEHGVSGMTSNPSIFKKAIGDTCAYDETIARLAVRMPGVRAEALYEQLAIEDVRTAADMLRPVYEASGKRDGFVSLEVTPRVAHDAEATVRHARRLWRAVARPNLMIKVPATPAGIATVTPLIAEGINVNVTLMFSLAHYQAAATAYLRGLERNEHPADVNSVASFFVSRIDTAVDTAIDAIATPRALALRGRAALAYAQRVYARFRKVLGGTSFQRQRRRGAHVQRLLWGSTGTKDPAYSDLKYVENLIGPDTINTMPLATLEAFGDHGDPRVTLAEHDEEARHTLEQLAGAGIDIHTATARLQREGLQAFAVSYDHLLATVELKRRAVRAA